MSAVKTYQLKFKVTNLSGKTIKIYGIISGMCEKHAMEEGDRIAHDLVKSTDDYNKVKLVQMKKLGCDFMVVPGEKKQEHLMEGFFDHLKNKYQIKDEVEEKQVKPSVRGFFEFLKAISDAKDKQDYADGVAKAQEVNAEAKAKEETNTKVDDFTDAVKYSAETERKVPERDTTVNS